MGTLQPRKNVERLLAAWLMLPAAVRAERALVIVGAPGSRSEALVASMAAARAAGENLVWLDRLTDQEQLRHLYAGAGVVPGSDPWGEAAETGAKYGALLAALGIALDEPAR